MAICATGPPYRRYMAAEIDAANDTDLPDLLASLGYQVKRVGSYYTTKEMDSIRIKDRRVWFRNSESAGGDAISFVQHFHGMSFPEAVRFLLSFNGYPVDSPVPVPRQRSRPPPQRERPAFVLPPPNGDNGRVHAYLQGRSVSPGVIDEFIEAGLLYEDREHHNCVFVGRPIDLISWFTLYGRSNAVALCGLYDGPLETYLADYPHIRRILLCLDADGPGREVAGRLGEKYRGLGYETEERFPPSGKDWNDFLITSQPGW